MAQAFSGRRFQEANTFLSPPTSLRALIAESCLVETAYCTVWSWAPRTWRACIGDLGATWRGVVLMPPFAQLTPTERKRGGGQSIMTPCWISTSGRAGEPIAFSENAAS